MKNKFHPFHIVEIRPWPIFTALTIINTTISLTVWIHTSNSIPVLINASITRLIAFLWWKDVIKESKNQGNHQKKVIEGIKIGIILFIISEVLFFVSFFWGFFHRRISPTLEIGQTWPPTGIKRFNPINVPLLNTIILLSSGVSITWSHHASINNKIKKATKRIIYTVILGVYFSCLQYIEYKEAEFSIRDSAYGSTFFIATGFHGIHVLIGTTFLIVSATRIIKIEISITHIIGFEIAAWYWHFVDVVWLFLYLSIYWWGS